MKITEEEYIRHKIEEEKNECINLSDKHSQALKIMIESGSQESKDNYRKIREKLDIKEYWTLFYMDIALMLKDNKTQDEIVNEFKIKLNREKDSLKEYKEIYNNEHPLMIGTPLSRKRMEVEQLEAFMEAEIYNHLL